MLKRFTTFTSWLLGVYILLFATSFYVHVNETRIISNKANSLLPKLTDNNFSGLHKITIVQNRKRKTKPIFFKPPTLFNSLFGEREFVNSVNQLLKNRIEKLKGGLDNVIFANAHLEGTNLSNASMFNTDLKSAKLANADLSDANLIYADLEKTDFHGANLSRTNFYKSHFKNTILQGANLSGAKNITCAQITLAMIDQNTNLPDYISIEDTQCINLHEGKGSDLSNMNLAHGDFLKENFADANLNQANLKGADLTTAMNITCDQLASAIIDKNTRLPDYIYVTLPPQSAFKCVNLVKGNGVDLKAADLGKIYLHRPDLQSANLSLANLKNSHLYAANLADTNLNQANLKGADLRTVKNITCDQVMSAVIDKNTRLPDYIYLPQNFPSSFKCISLLKGEGVDLSGANLSGIHLHDQGFKANLRNSNLSDTNFMGAKIGFINFSNANLNNANLGQTDLKGANFTNANLNKTNLKGANLNKAINVTCDQVMSAVIDRNTRLPDYIHLLESSQSIQKCRKIVTRKK